MNSKQNLIDCLTAFLESKHPPVEWAKETEAVLDSVTLDSEMRDDLQEALSLYRPEGGPHLLDHREMTGFLTKFITRLGK